MLSTAMPMWCELENFMGLAGRSRADVSEEGKKIQELKKPANFGST